MVHTHGCYIETCSTTKELGMRKKYEKAIFTSLKCDCLVYNYWRNKTDTGLLEPLWSIQLNCQVIKIEYVHSVYADALITSKGVLLSQRTLGCCTLDCHIKNRN